MSKWNAKSNLSIPPAHQIKEMKNVRAISPHQFEVLNDGLTCLKGNTDFWVNEPL